MLAMSGLSGVDSAFPDAWTGPVCFSKSAPACHFDVLEASHILGDRLIGLVQYGRLEIRPAVLQDKLLWELV